MRCILLYFTFLVCSTSLHAQFTNDGGTIVIGESSSLNIMSLDLYNINSGDIVNFGSLIIEGELNNELGSTFESAEDAVTQIGESGTMSFKEYQGKNKKSNAAKSKMKKETSKDLKKNQKQN